MANENLLCKNLSLSIWLEQIPDGDDLIKIRLVSKLALKKVEKTVEITAEPRKMIPYHIEEAIVIAMRRLISDAVKEGLISVNPGKSPDRKSTRLNSSHSGESRMPSSA